MEGYIYPKNKIKGLYEFNGIQKNVSGIKELFEGLSLLIICLCYFINSC